MRDLPVLKLTANFHVQVSIVIRGAEEGSVCAEEEASKMVGDTQTSDMSWAPAGEPRSKSLSGSAHNLA